MRVTYKVAHHLKFETSHLAKLNKEDLEPLAVYSVVVYFILWWQGVKYLDFHTTPLGQSTGVFRHVLPLLFIYP